MTAEITEDQILTEYGGLLWDALRSFGQDPTYFADMCESANLIEYKRKLWEARADAVARAETPDQVRDITERLLEERGVQAPQRRRRAA